ncbi:DUF1854 domain-containing protein [Paenibacillus sediminis]|uniref:DUF1854 domain-containing protein n=1 Tax=Paenibacillus sediminis TaxID=664909 RepID=A0ABS4H4C1_9BACL|nr:DUF1854 domain-containing protein [Paenibacillus sediminis]MBP1937379.1 hypothetical protein [Paenibacillus sediminis]
MKHITYMNRVKPYLIRFFRSKDGTLHAEADGKWYGPVKLIRTFPFSMPEQHISVRLENGDELMMIPHLSQLDEGSRSEALEELARCYMLPSITKIVSISRKGWDWSWVVHTSYGMKTFKMDNLHDNMYQVTSMSWVITDQEGRRYELSGVEDMDKVSQAQFKKIK